MSDLNPYSVPKSAIESSQALLSRQIGSGKALLRISMVITYVSVLLIALCFAWGFHAGLIGVLFNGVSLVATTLMFVSQLILTVACSLHRTDSLFNWHSAVMLFNSLVLLLVWGFTYMVTFI